jgi:hypothetical protein
MNWRISGSVRLWFGIGMLLYSFSIALACGSVFSIVSGDFSQRTSQSSVRCFGHAGEIGPQLLAAADGVAGEALALEASLPATASGSVGVAVAGMLWCSSSWAGGLAAVETRPIAPCEALAKWWSTMM